MDKVTLFTDLEPYKLTGVTVTDQELGHGSYATVLELEYMRLKCAGKKIHEIFLKERHDNQSYTIRRFQNECHILSKIHHPNIVQFLGIYFQTDVDIPILVMEFLPTNLTACIKEYHGTILQDISYTILHDVALGLCYLHNMDPPIIHRDLSSNNVLLTSNMTAKISDLGVARILDINPLQSSSMSQTPGTPAFMPPEVMVAKPNYNTSVDCFSYGIMMIHIFSGKWPEPQIGPNRHQDNQLFPVSEAERRDTFLQIIGNTHPLMDLIQKCIQNNPQLRANANEIETDLARFTHNLENRMEIMRTHSEEVKKLQQKIELLQRENELLLEKKEKDEQILKDQSTCFDGLLEPIKIENDELRSKVKTLEKKLVDTDTTLKLTINDYELLRSNLNSQSLPTVAKHVTLTREIQPHKQQPIEVIITWKKCKNLPTSRSLAQSIVINGKVYFGGGLTDEKQAKYLVHCYDPSEDKWTDLPPLPVHSFGLGQVNGKLVVVGGKSEDNQRTSDVYMYDPRSEEWVKKTSMQIPRASSTVVGLKSALVVVGGHSNEYVDIVEILNPHTLKKQKSEPLPTAASNMSVFPINENECYILGGYRPSSISCPCENKVFHAKLDNLLRKVIPTEHTTPVDIQPAWKQLPDTPTYQPAAAMLVGSLLAIGGWETSEGKIASTKVHAYSPSTNSWVHINDLPAPRAVTTAAVLSPTELLVIGGYDNIKRVNVMYKGTLTIRM